MDSLAERGIAFDLFSTIREWGQHHFVRLDFRGIPIDWMKPSIPAYEHTLDKATDVDWQGQTIRVVSVEGLIFLKLYAFRLQYQLDTENLLAIHGNNFDIDWLRTEWQTVGTLEDPRFVWFTDKLAGRK